MKIMKLKSLPHIHYTQIDGVNHYGYVNLTEREVKKLLNKNIQKRLTDINLKILFSKKYIDEPARYGMEVSRETMNSILSDSIVFDLFEIVRDNNHAEYKIKNKHSKEVSPLTSFSIEHLDNLLSLLNDHFISHHYEWFD